ncbi:putative DNA-binding protein [Enterobacter hormaechei]|uniref:antiviral reverse transcriptase Drt3b n=1 Tax=Enterobacter hormaechei TaxID=158836 RepID=UPI00125C15E6|nr:antiviral reverse transcriptase Drt3b [Enterobacter hormaechei]VAC50151.1 putative DNA-binding protein [Enterobacter hormaechei]
MDKVIIKKHDTLRTLLTETLPYEVPLIFSNIGFYKFLKKRDKASYFFKDLLVENKSPMIPFNYFITKNEKSTRKISIPHPIVQYEIGNLIHSNAEYITYLCSKSNFSIRKPTAVAAYYYESSPFDSQYNSELKDDDVAQQDTNEDEKYSSSYFSYDGYTLLYKFFNSLKFQSIEKKFSYSLRFDIAKCFSSIYTHSISWAIKGKVFSKENLSSNSFDSKFDHLLMRMNDNETNGILIGPEFSRVFAEIILQAIDVAVERDLEEKGYRNNFDYVVKRYVDDYFVFTKNENVSDIIYDSFIHEMAKFKLYINESKEQRERRPFITKLTIAKTHVLSEISDFFKSIKRDKNHLPKNEWQTIPSIVFIYKPYTRSNTLITKFKSIVKQNDTNYDAFSGLMMSVLRSRLQRINNEIQYITDIETYSSTYRNFIIFNIDFLSFLFAMNIKSRTSHLMSQLIVIIGEINAKLVKSDQDEVIKKLKDETRILIDIAVQNGKPRIEFINFMIAVRSIFKDAVLDDESIKHFYKIDNNMTSHLDYFETCSCLHLLCNKNNNNNLVESIYFSFQEKINNTNNPRNHSEIAHLLLDLGTFPHIPIDIYKDALKLYFYKTYGIYPTVQEVNAIYNKIRERKLFFIDWNESINIKKLLQKKEMQRGYDS